MTVVVVDMGVATLVAMAPTATADTIANMKIAVMIDGMMIAVTTVGTAMTDDMTIEATAETTIAATTAATAMITLETDTVDVTTMIAMAPAEAVLAHTTVTDTIAHPNEIPADLATQHPLVPATASPPLDLRRASHMEVRVTTERDEPIKRANNSRPGPTLALIPSRKARGRHDHPAFSIIAHQWLC